MEKKGDINVFSAKKVLQEIAYLLKLNSKRMPLIKLIKELYLIDRLSIDERETSISGDSFFCMAHGPVLSFTLNMLRDVSRSEWGDYLLAIQTRDYFPDIFINKETKEDLLSEKEKEYISRISEEFFNYSSAEIADFTRRLPECNYQEGSSKKIKFADIMTALRKSDKDIRAAKEEYEFFEKIYTEYIPELRC